MRILSVVSSLGSGGAETLVRNLSVELANRGHECHIAYLSEAVVAGASEEYEARFKNELNAAGVGYSAIGHDCRRRPWRGAQRLRAVVNETRPDILHVHLGYGLLFQTLGLIRLPTVYTHHNVELKFNGRLFRLFDRFVDAYIAICAPCEGLLGRYVRRPIVRIHNGVPSSFALVEERTSPAGIATVLSVGNLTTQKDYTTLIDAATVLASTGRRVRFLIAGEGEERDTLAAYISAAGIAGSVELLGARSDVAALMADSHLLAMSSRWEGLPIALIEAAMSSLPIVATDVGGCSEIVEDGVNGRLVAPGDATALADAIWEIFRDADRYRRFSAASRQISRRFGMAGCADKHVELYDALVKLQR